MGPIQFPSGRQLGCFILVISAVQFTGGAAVASLIWWLA